MTHYICEDFKFMLRKIFDPIRLGAGVLSIDDVALVFALSVRVVRQSVIPGTQGLSSVTGTGLWG